MDTLWREQELALRVQQSEEGTDAADGSRFLDATGRAVASLDTDAHLDSRSTTVTKLPDGDIHVCFGLGCAHAVLDKASHMWVCELTGHHLGVQPRQDANPGWTGRSVASANPDDASGAPRGGWRRKANQWQLSVEAHILAQTIDDAEVNVLTPPASQARAPTRGATKRGAQCVDVRDVDASVDTPPTPDDRLERCDAPCATPQARDKLRAEASSVVDSLLSTQHAQPAQPAQAAASAPDVRLQSIEYVLRRAFKKLVQEAAEGKRPFNQSAVHDVCVKAHEFVRAQRRDAAERNSRVLQEATSTSITAQGLSGIAKRHCVDLVVALWEALHATTYMRTDGVKRGSDSFRPFAAGVLYGMKRGTKMSNGAVIIPVLPSVAALLPQLRSQNAKHGARQLQSSSHRGLCSLHRAVASLDEMPSGPAVERALALFSRASTHAGRLQRYFEGGNI